MRRSRHTACFERGAAELGGAVIDRFVGASFDSFDYEKPPRFYCNVLLVLGWVDKQSNSALSLNAMVLNSTSALKSWKQTMVLIAAAPLSARAQLPSTSLSPRVPQQLPKLGSPRLELAKKRDVVAGVDGVSGVPNLSPRRSPRKKRVEPAHVTAARRTLWMSDVRRWCDGHEKHIQGWGWDQKEEEEFAEWFHALDIDQSNSIEEDEVRALMNALGITPEPGQMKAMFAAVGKKTSESLSRPDFVRFMMKNMHILAGSSFASTTGQLFDANTRLMMLAYRRARLLQDLADPQKRRNFRDFESFNDAYGPTLGLEKDEDEAGEAPAHAPQAASAAAAPGSARGQRSPRLPRMAPSPRPPSDSLAPPPKHRQLMAALGVIPEPGAEGLVPANLPALSAAMGVPVWGPTEPEELE